MIARGGRHDARVLEAQGVSAGGPEPGAIRGAQASLRAPQSAAEQPRVAGSPVRGTGIADAELAADGTPRLETSLERVEEGDAVRRLRLAAADARGGGAARFAVQKVLAIRAGSTRREGAAAARLGALGALRVTCVDLARARGCPAVRGATDAAAHRADRAARAVELTGAEKRRMGRVRRASSKRDPGQRNVDERDGQPPHSTIDHPGDRRTSPPVGP